MFAIAGHWLGAVSHAIFAKPRADSAVGVLMVALGHILPHIGFGPEVKNAEAFLVETLNGEIENPAK